MIDKEAEKKNAERFIGKTLSEIIDITKAERRENMDMNNKLDPHRKEMLTVKKLMDFLATCNPDACIVAYEDNSFAYTEQMPELPNHCICTVKQDKEWERENLERWYKDTENAKSKIDLDMQELYRYVDDDDIVLRFG